MELDWSERSPHIRSLFPVWRPGDGFTEEAISAAEMRLGIRAPATLRAFYKAWGQRRDLMRMNHWLLAPEEWIVHSNALIFCVESQGCAYWAVPLESLGEPDTPVVVAEAGRELVPELQDVLEWRISHQHVADFLDNLTYLHAFCGGASHGARLGTAHPLPWQTELLEQNWRQTVLTSIDLRYPENGPDVLYVQDGQAIQWYSGLYAVASGSESLDHIAATLAIDWDKRW